MRISELGGGAVERDSGSRQKLAKVLPLFHELKSNFPIPLASSNAQRYGTSELYNEIKQCNEKTHISNQCDVIELSKR